MTVKVRLQVCVFNWQLIVCSNVFLYISLCFIHTHEDRQWVRHCYDLFNHASGVSSWCGPARSRLLARASRAFSPTAEKLLQTGLRQTQQTNTSSAKTSRVWTSTSPLPVLCCEVNRLTQPCHCKVLYTSTHSAKMIRFDKCCHLQSC